MKKLLQTSLLLSTIFFSTQSMAIFMPGDEVGAALFATTSFPTLLTTCIGGECGLKELDMPALEKEALEVLATEDEKNISEELNYIIAKIKELEPRYQNLNSIDVLRREYIKGQKLQEKK